MAIAAERLGGLAPVRRGWLALIRAPAEATARAASAAALNGAEVAAAATLLAARAAAVFNQWRRAHATEDALRRLTVLAEGRLTLQRTRAGVGALRAASLQVMATSSMSPLDSTFTSLR